MYVAAKASSGLVPKLGHLAQGTKCPMRDVGVIDYLGLTSALANHLEALLLFIRIFPSMKRKTLAPQS
jgi:hypothetical protein